MRGNEKKGESVMLKEETTKINAMGERIFVDLTKTFPESPADALIALTLVLGAVYENAMNDLTPSEFVNRVSAATLLVIARHSEDLRHLGDEK